MSYAHENGIAGHRERVLELTESLRARGVDAWIDRYVEHDPPWWPRWMLDEVAAADFVLCVGSPGYKERWEGRGDVEVGRGARWEGAVVTEQMYANERAGNTKFIAVVLDDRPIGEIPDVLFPASRSFYRWPEDDEKLYRRLTNQPEVVPGPVLERVTLPPTEGRGVGVRQRARRVFLPGPAVHPAFQKREALVQALNASVAIRRRSVVTTVSGLGGVGKTQLVAAWFAEHAGDYEIAAWISAEHGGVEDFLRLAHGLGVAEEADIDLRLTGLRLRLEESEDAWLLVLDNLPSIDVLPQAVPSRGGGRIIVTTRDRAARQFGDTIDVDSFDTATGRAFLLAASGLSDDGHANELVEALGGMPLAIAHASAYCAATGAPFDEYLALVAGGLPAGALFDDPNSAVHAYGQTITATWRQSMEAAERLCDLAPRAMALCAVVAPQRIPVELFGALREGDAPLERKRIRDAIGALHRYSLLTAGQHHVSVHRLVQRISRDSLPPELVIDAVQLAVGFFAGRQGDERAPAAWPGWVAAREHVEALLDTAGARTDEKSCSAVVPLVNRLNESLHFAGIASRDLLHRANETAVRVLGPDHPATLTTRQNLARWLGEVGKVDEAVARFDALLADYLRVLGPTHPDTLATRHNLARWLGEAGRVDEAAVRFEALLVDRTTVLGADHPDTLATRHNLAYWLGKAGRIREAVPQFEALLADDIRLLGVDHPDTLNTRANLAYLLGMAGRVGEAVARFKALLADQLRVLGPNHPETLNVMASLARFTADPLS